MKLDSKHVSSNVQIFILRFYIFLSKLLINCVTRNKVARNERLSPVKHNYIIQGKILLCFPILNEVWKVCVSFAVKR